MYCKYSFVHGDDWTITSVWNYHYYFDSFSFSLSLSIDIQYISITQGISQGMTQSSSKVLMTSSHTSFSPISLMGGGGKTAVWSFPIEVSFRSTNISGWPRIALSVYGPDWLGHDAILGYGMAVLPIVSGR